jgi:hypothetical protein
MANYFYFLSGIILLNYLFHNGLDKKNLLLLYGCNAILILVHLFGSRKAQAFSEEQGNVLISSFNNSNMTGIIITSSLFILITSIFYHKKKYLKIASIILVIIGIYLLIQTNNRGSMLGLIVLFLLIIVSRGKSKSYNLYTKSILIFPIIFVFLILYLFNVLPTDIMINNKPLFSGRELEWQYIVYYMIENPFSTHTLPFSGLNYIIVGIIEYGIFAILFYILLLFNYRPNLINSGKINHKNVAYFAFVCIFIQQSFEATLITGSYGVYIFNYMLLGISQSNDINS